MCANPSLHQRPLAAVPLISVNPHDVGQPLAAEREPMHPKTPVPESAILSRKVGCLVGFFIGLAFGFVVNGAIWLYAFVATFETHTSVNVPLIVQTSMSGGDVTGVSGWGIILVPLCCAAAFGLIGLWATSYRFAVRARRTTGT
jgi:hypothetical protein